MNAATRYAHEFLLARPAVVVLRAPTGYLKTSTTRVAAQLARRSVIVDCRELTSRGEVEAALRTRVASAFATAGIEDFVAFENAESALARPDVLAAIHEALSRRAPLQTIAICTRRPFPLPVDVIDDAVELTHEDLAVDVAAELADRGLPPERIAEIQRLTLGWPMPTYRLASVAAACPDGVPLLTCRSAGLDRLLQDVRLDFVDRLPSERRARLLDVYRTDRDAIVAYAEPDGRGALFSSKQARVNGLVLRDGAGHRVPGIVVAALDALPALPDQRTGHTPAAPSIVFDVLTGEITAEGKIVRLPPREFEVFVNLAIKGRHVPYDVLLEEVWGDADDDHAKLKVTVGRLRKRLGTATIRSLDAGYAIGEGVTCTLTELAELARVNAPFGEATYTRLDALCARYRRGLHTVRSWPWYATWSTRIDAFVEHALIALGNHALAQRRFTVALDRAREAIALNAVSQDAHELGLRALIALGNVVAARQMVAAYAETLDRTLGIPLPDALAHIVYDVAS
jgi:hypothetical protein